MTDSLSEENADGRWHGAEQAIRALTVEVEREWGPAPAELAHYTTLSAAASIIEGHALWLTHTDFMNDPEEIRYGMRVTQQAFAAMDSADARIRGLVERLHHWFEEVVSGDDNHAFLASVSVQRDLLSQWRAYAEGGSGCALVFNVLEIPDASFGHERANGLLQVPALYDRDGQLELARRGIDKISEVACKAMDDGVPFDAVGNGMGRALHRWALFCGMAMKQPAFREEMEWRLLALTSMGLDALNICRFRPTRSGLAPYYAWEFGPQYPKVLREVRLGPRASTPQNRRSFEWLLRQQGYEFTEVTLADGSYR